MLKTQRAVVPLLLVLLIDAMGIGLIFPILAPMFSSNEASFFDSTLSQGLRDFYYGLTVAVFFICTFFASPFLGGLSDQLGRRKVLLLCLSAIAASYVISALGVLLHSLWLVIIGRAIAGFGAGSQPIAQAAIVDVSDARTKTLNLSFISMASCVGFVIGPVIGGYFSYLFIAGWYGFVVPFVLAGILAAANAIYLYFAFADTQVVVKTNLLASFKIATTLRLAFASSALWRTSVIFFLMQLAWGTYFQFISLFLANDFNYSPGEIGLFMSYLGMLFTLSLTVIIRLFLRKMLLAHLTLMSLILILFGFLCAAFSRGELAHWLCAIPVAVGVAMSYAALLTYFSNRADKNAQGMIMGVSGSLLAIAWVVDGLLLGVLRSFGNQVPFLVAGALILVAIVLMVLDKERG